MEAIKENKVTRQKLAVEYKKQTQPCGQCLSLRQKLRKSQDETEKNQELYFGQKTQFNEECHKYRVNLNEMRQENQKQKIEIREIEAEKRTIMRKLVQTMLKYEHETSFNNQAKVFKNQSYSNDVDYMTMPTCKPNRRSKMVMPATKEVMRESKRRHTKKVARQKNQTTTHSNQTPLAVRDFFEEDEQESFTIMSSEASSYVRNAINLQTFEQMNDETEPNEVQHSQVSIAAVPKLRLKPLSPCKSQV